MMNGNDITSLNMKLNSVLFDRFDGCSWVGMVSYDTWNSLDDNTVSLASITIYADTTGVTDLPGYMERVYEATAGVMAEELPEGYGYKIRRKPRTTTFADGFSKAEDVIFIATTRAGFLGRLDA